MEESVDLAGQLKQAFDCGAVDIRTYSPLTLAFVGDGIYDLIIRTVLVERGNRGVQGMHKSKSALVKAATQAAMAEALTDVMNQEEEGIYRRGRNATTHSSAKNASIADYRKATGFEALCGYLYLTGQIPRLIELIQAALEKLGLSV